MKTAIFIPEDIFRRAERRARRLGKSRGQLYSEAIAEYVRRRSQLSIEHSRRPPQGRSRRE